MKISNFMVLSFNNLVIDRLKFEIKNASYKRTLKTSKAFGS